MFDISTSKSGLRPSVFLRLLTSRASRHNGVQLFISHLARWLRTRRFSQPTFRPYKSLEKHSVSPLCYLFAHLHLLSSDSFSSLIFIFLLFSSLTLPTSAFPSVHIVGSLTPKLPSIISSSYSLFHVIFQLTAQDSSQSRISLSSVFCS